MAAAARAATLGRGSAAKDCPRATPLPNRPLSCRRLHLGRRLDRLWPGIPLAPCHPARGHGRCARASSGNRPVRFRHDRGPCRRATEWHLGGSPPLRLRHWAALVDRQCRRSAGSRSGGADPPCHSDHFLCLRSDPFWRRRTAAGRPDRGMYKDNSAAVLRRTDQSDERG